MKKANYIMVQCLMMYWVVFIFASVLNAAEISRDARKYMIRGQAAMEEAKDVADYQAAVEEFKKATKIAPNLPEAWFNLGIAQEKAEDYVGAIKSFNKYLELNPNAKDRTAVEDQIFKLEYKQEKEAKKVDLSGRWKVIGGRSYWEFNRSGSEFLGVFYLYHDGKIWDNQGQQFLLRVDGRSVSGTYTRDWTHMKGGSIFRHSVHGTLSTDGNEMTLHYRDTMPQSWSDVDCTKSLQRTY